MSRVHRPRTDRDRALRRRKDHVRAVNSLEEARELTERRAESVILETIAHEELYRLRPEIRPSLEELREDMASVERERDRETVIPIEVGQVWEGFWDTIRILELRTETGGDGGHFICLVRDAENEDRIPYEIDAARIRMDYDLVKGAASPGQMELF